MSSGTKFRCGLDGAHPRASLSQKPDHIGLFGTKTTQNPRPTPRDKSETQHRRIRDPIYVFAPDRHRGLRFLGRDGTVGHSNLKSVRGDQHGKNSQL